MRRLLPLLVILSCTVGVAAFSPPGAGDPLTARLERAVKRALPAGAKVKVEGATTFGSAPASATLTLLGPNPPAGVVSYQLEWSGDNGRPCRVYGSARISARLRIAVAKAPIRFDEKLGPENVALEERDLQVFSQTGYFTAWPEVSSRRAGAFLRPGDVLGAANTRVPKPVTFGQMLELVDEKGNLSIRARVRALEEGNLSQWIKVENVSSHRTLQARISAPGEVRLR